MKPEANIKQKTKAEPLFGSIEPEWIELEDVEGKPQKLLRPTPKEILLLLAVFLSVFIDNGEVALPLFLVIPEVLINVLHAPFWVTLPCLVAVVGIGMACYHFQKMPKDRSDYRVKNFGLTLLCVALYFFLKASESFVVTFFGSLVFAGIYLYLAKKYSKQQN